MNPTRLLRCRQEVGNEVSKSSFCNTHRHCCCHNHHQGSTGCRCCGHPSSRVAGGTAVCLQELLVRGWAGGRRWRGRPNTLGVLRPELVGDGNAAGAVDQRPVSDRLVVHIHDMGRFRCGKECVSVRFVWYRAEVVLCSRVARHGDNRLAWEPR